MVNINVKSRYLTIYAKQNELYKLNFGTPPRYFRISTNINEADTRISEGTMNVIISLKEEYEITETYKECIVFGDRCCEMYLPSFDSEVLYIRPDGSGKITLHIYRG